MVTTSSSSCTIGSGVLDTSLEGGGAGEGGSGELIISSAPGELRISSVQEDAANDGRFITKTSISPVPVIDDDANDGGR